MIMKMPALLSNKGIYDILALIPITNRGILSI